MRILILNWRGLKHPRAGGAEKATFEYAKAWVSAGHKVNWLTARPHGSRRFEKIEGVAFLRYGNPLSIYFLVPAIYFLRFRGEVDLVVDEIHGLPFFTPLYVKERKLAFICEVAQEIWDEMFAWPLSAIGRLLEKIYFRLLYRNVPFLTISASTEADLVRFGVPQKNIKVIQCGVDLKSLEAVPLKEDELTVIFISRLVKMKGIEEAIRAFFFIKKVVPDAKFWVIGSGNEKYILNLKNLCSELGLGKSVKFWWFVSEEKKVELLKKAHFLIHTSVREGWGLVVIEANTQGTPAIVYNSPGLRDSVQSGINGVLISENKPQILAKSLLGMWKDKERYQALCRSSLDYSRRFSWKRQTRKSLKLLEHLGKI